MSFLATTEFGPMDTEKKRVTKEFLVTITVEEVEVPEAVPTAPNDPFSHDVEEFFDEGDYGSPK